jgi:hypothetical protein
MRMVACAYPPDWAVKETIALPIFSDQVPLRGLAGRIDFRLNGLISGLLLEQLIQKDDYWLLINPERIVAPELLLVPAGLAASVDLEKVSRWLQKVCAKLAGAGAQRYSIAVNDLYRFEFSTKDFAGLLIKTLADYQPEEVRLYVNLDLSELLVQELSRWLHHVKIDGTVELMRSVVPVPFQEKAK